MGEKIKKEKKTELLKHIFNDQEKQKIGEDLAASIQKINGFEDQLVSVSSSLKASIKEQEASVNKMANNLRQGYDYRETDVEIEFNWNKGKVIKTRLDTMEIYEEREMFTEERQKKLL